MDIASILAIVAGIISVVVLVFLLCREIIRWFLKVTEMMDLLTEIRDLLKSRRA